MLFDELPEYDLYLAHLIHQVEKVFGVRFAGLIILGLADVFADAGDARAANRASSDEVLDQWRLGERVVDWCRGKQHDFLRVASVITLGLLHRIVVRRSCQKVVASSMTTE